MKLLTRPFALCLLISFLFSCFINAQNPYSSLNDDYREIFDDIPIDKGQEKEFFDYAVKLYQLDSLKKAGQIFDRLFWLDTTSETGRQSLSFRKKIEEKIIQQTQANLHNSLRWTWSGSNWGQTDWPEKSNTTKRIELDGKTIRFYQNDTLVRKTGYLLVQSFNWVFGFLNNQIQYLDNNEVWFFNLGSLEGFTSESIWIERKSDYVCGNYGESYLLNQKK
jgi:hypothetical protein